MPAPRQKAERIAVGKLSQTHGTLQRAVFAKRFRLEVGNERTRGEHARVDAAARGVRERVVGVVGGAVASVDGTEGCDEEGKDEDNE